MCSLPWAQHKRWISISSMGCVHTHQKMPIIEGWGNPNCVWKTGEDNWKVEKIGRATNQTLALGPEHDKIRARWALDVPSESMLERVWWWRCSEMESWSWTICCPMNCSNGGKHAWAGGGRKSHTTLRCCWKGNVLLLIHVKAQERWDVDKP